MLAVDSRIKEKLRVELKNALAVCLISLFSATLVVLIARSLDSQAASKIEPQLAKISEELQALRQEMRTTPLPGQQHQASQTKPTADNALIVYYFHGIRCATCRAAEKNALAALQSHYAKEFAQGTMVWKVLDYGSDPTAKTMAQDFGVTTSTIVLAKQKDGELDQYNRLDRTLALAKKRDALAKYLQSEIDSMLQKTAPPTTDPPTPHDLPVPP